MKKLGRTLSMILILLLAFAASRGLVRTLPGDPLETILAETGTSIPAELIRAEMGLDRPFFPALVSDVKKAFQGDLGHSLISREPVGTMVAAAFLRTVLLTCVAIALGLAISLAIGLPASFGGKLDGFCSLYGSVTAALPTPWIGPLLAYMLGVAVPIFSLGGSIWLPAFTIALGFSGFWSRLIRERVRENLLFGPAACARSRGLPEWKIALKYGLAPVSGAMLGYLGTQAGALLAGTFVTELVFDWPGMGTLLVESVLRRDYPVVEASVFMTATGALFGTLVGDWAQSTVDPRREAK